MLNSSRTVFVIILKLKLLGEDLKYGRQHFLFVKGRQGLVSNPVEV